MDTALIVIAVIAIGAAMAGAAALTLYAADSMVVTDSDQTFRYTQTISSKLSPGVGHEAHHIAMILPPRDGAIYGGTLTYTASVPLDIVVLHEMDSSDSRGQPIWEMSDGTIYGWTFIDASSTAESFEYAGAGLILHTVGDEFVVTVTVDGSVRGNVVSLPYR